MLQTSTGKHSDTPTSPRDSTLQRSIPTLGCSWTDAQTRRSDLNAPMFQPSDALVSDYPTLPQADSLTRATMLWLPQTDTRKHLTGRLSDASNPLPFGCSWTNAWTRRSDTPTGRYSVSNTLRPTLGCDPPTFRLSDALVSDYPTLPQADSLTSATMLWLPQTDTRKHSADRLSDSPTPRMLPFPGPCATHVMFRLSDTPKLNSDTRVSCSGAPTPTTRRCNPTSLLTDSSTSLAIPLCPQMAHESAPQIHRLIFIRENVEYIAVSYDLQTLNLCSKISLNELKVCTRRKIH